MEFDSVLEDKLPRASIFKVGGSANSTVQKREWIEYLANKGDLLVRDHTSKVQFLVSGECLVDGLSSFFSLRLATNTFTSALSGDITSIIKKVVIKLPSNSNQVLEEIDNYNTLSSMVSTLTMDNDTLSSKWYAGSNCLVENKKSQGLAKSRRFLNLNKGGFRTFTFQLHLCNILSLEQYLPLFLMNGILIELHLASPQEAFHYVRDNEEWRYLFDRVEGLGFTQDEYDGLTEGQRGRVERNLIEFYNRREPASQSLTYEIRDFKYNACAVWMSETYVNKLTEKAQSESGLNLFYDTYRFNQINSDGNLFMNVTLSEQFQNLKKVLFGTLDRSKLQSQNEHSFNIFPSGIQRYKFRIGSRSWEQIVNEHEEDALSFTRSLLSLGQYGKRKSNSITFTTWSRNKNIHVFDFQKVAENVHSGQDTTDGLNLKFELQWKAQEEVSLLDDVLLQQAINPTDGVIYMYLKATHLINISSRGIGVSS